MMQPPAQAIRQRRSSAVLILALSLSSSFLSVAGDRRAARDDNSAPAQACSGEQPPDDTSPAFRFSGEEYFLRGDGNGIREYLTRGEVFEHWTRLISTREFPDIRDPRAYALELVKQAKSSSPEARGQVLADEDSGSYIADFLVFSPEGESPSFAEWNLWRIEKKGRGIEAVQYARRFYQITESTADTINSQRKKLIPLLAGLKIPANQPAR